MRTAPPKPAHCGALCPKLELPCTQYPHPSTVAHVHEGFDGDVHYSVVWFVVPRPDTPDPDLSGDVAHT